MNDALNFIAFNENKRDGVIEYIKDPCIDIDFKKISEDYENPTDNISRANGAFKILQEIAENYSFSNELI